MQELSKQLHQPMVNLLLTIADDKLFLGHRNSDWTGLAPILEADIAFSSLAQDDIAHASALYELASSFTNKSADELAFGRQSNEYLCTDIVTKNDQFDWANAIARQFYCGVLDYLRFKRLSNSSWAPLAALANRLAKEQTIQVDHINTWIDQLGRGNDDSINRIQNALDTYASVASKMFEAPEGIELLLEEGVVPNEGCLFTAWKEMVDQITQPAGLTVSVEQDTSIGGRHGQHDDDFNQSLSELQEVYLQDPATTW